MTMTVRGVQSTDSTSGGVSTTLSISAPSGLTNGDFMLWQVSASSDVSFTTPSGWTLIDTATLTGEGASGNKTAVYYRVAASEGSTFTFTFGSAFITASMGIIAWYSSVAATILLDANANALNASNTTSHVAPSVTTTKPNAALHNFYSVSQSATGSPHSGMTERWDKSGSASAYCMTAIVSGTGSTGTRTMTGANETSAAITVAIAEDIVDPPDAAPTSLTATAISSTQINLAWTDNSSNEDGFQVERSPNGSTSWTLIATTAANATTYSNTGLTEATTYYYRVRATNASGNSGYTSVASALTYPAAPTSLTATAIDDTQTDLSWTDNSAGETGFKVERSANGTTGWTQIGTTAANDTTYSDTGLSPGATWYYRVCAYNATGNSAYSNVVSVTTHAAPQTVYDVGAVVSFDWDYNGTYTDETGYLVSAKGTQRVAPPSQSITASQGQVAQCTLILNNSTGRFSSLNSGGALYGYVGQGKAYQVPVIVQLSSVAAGASPSYVVVFRGYARIPSEVTLNPDQAKTITFDCRGLEDILLNKKTRTSQADFRTYRDEGVTESQFLTALIEDNAPDLTALADGGLVTLPWAWIDNESVLEALWALAAACGGRVYGVPAGGTGYVAYENAAHWLYAPHDTSQMSYARATGYKALELIWNDTEIAQEVAVSWTEREVGGDDTLYDSDRIVSPAGETITVWANFDAPAYAITAITTTAGTNGGADLSGSVSITPTYYAQSTKLIIANSGGVQANVKVKITGKAAQDGASQTVSEESADSFWTNRVGRTRKVSGNKWVQSAGHANFLLDFIQSRQYLPSLQAKLRGCPGIASRKIGDRITITDSELYLSATDFWVTAISWSYSSRGYVQELEAYRCTDLFPYVGASPGYFIIGTNKLGAADALRGRVFF